MKSFSNKETNYSLHNSENFKKELEPEIHDIVNKISDLFIEYFKCIKENIKLKKTNFSRFIITRGLDTIVNVFNHILFYTKNINTTYFHCQKAFYFYIEFVSQISEDEKMFLQLTSRDATNYVYKKTIFEISNELRKSNEEITDYTRVKLDIINYYIELYKTLLLKLINEDFNDLEKLEIIENIYNKLNNLSNDIIDKLYYHIEDVKYFLDICSLLIKKSHKKYEKLENCLNKFTNDEFKDKLTETPDKFVNWFMG